MNHIEKRVGFKLWKLTARRSSGSGRNGGEWV